MRWGKDQKVDGNQEQCPHALNEGSEMRVEVGNDGLSRGNAAQEDKMIYRDAKLHG
jgi:hypothetical protein